MPWQVPAVRQAHPEDRVAGRKERPVDRHVGAGPGVRLQVGVVGSEQFLGPGDPDLLGPVDDLAPTVVALTRVPLGVLVRQSGPERGQDGRGGEVLARDQLQPGSFPGQLVGEDGGDLGIEGGQGVEVRAPERVAHADVPFVWPQTPGSPGASADGRYLGRLPPERVLPRERTAALSEMAGPVAASKPGAKRAQALISGTTSRSLSRLTAPGRSTRGISPVTSTIVDATAAVIGPPSR